jgi:hypothetical protein
MDKEKAAVAHAARLSRIVIVSLSLALWVGAWFMLWLDTIASFI